MGCRTNNCGSRKTKQRRLAKKKARQAGNRSGRDAPTVETARKAVRRVQRKRREGDAKNALETQEIVIQAPDPPHSSKYPFFYRTDAKTPVDFKDLFVGQTCFLCLNGPSFNEVDKGPLRQPGIVTYCVNNGAHGFRPNLWSCLDPPHRFMRSIWEDPTIMKFIPMENLKRRVLAPEDGEDGHPSGPKASSFPNLFGFSRNSSFDANKFLTEGTVNWGNTKRLGGGRSVMVASMKVMYILGFRRVFLLGCDFSMSEDNRYWFDEQRSKGAIRNNNRSYGKMNGYFDELRPHFEEAGFVVHNCYEQSGLKSFDYMPLDEALDVARTPPEYTEASTYGMYVRRGRKAKKANEPSKADKEKAARIQRREKRRKRRAAAATRGKP